jgi:hypothetical protein
MSNLRKDTLNRLNNCDCHTPAPPFPSHVMPISLFEEMMYKVAYVAGYIGTKKEFAEDLAATLNGAGQIAGLIVQKGSIEEFPDIGLENAIYIDTAKNHIYYWKGDGYYRIQASSGSGEDGETVIPSDGLTYDGGEI